MELGRILGINDQSVGNYFDGTRKLNSNTFSVLWKQLCLNLKKQEDFYSPLLLFVGANICENMLFTRHTNQKLKSVTIIDREHYTDIWLWHRQRWSNELKQGKEGWPSWLDT
jgi:hypothetical protein